MIEITDFFDAAIAALKDDEVLAAIVAARVFEDIAPQQDPANPSIAPAWPYVTLTNLSSESAIRQGGEVGQTELLVLAKVVGPNFHPAHRTRMKNAANRIDAVMTTLSGTQGSLIIAGCVREPKNGVFRNSEYVSQQVIVHLGGRYRGIVHPV